MLGSASGSASLILVLLLIAVAVVGLLVASSSFAVLVGTRALHPYNVTKKINTITF